MSCYRRILRPATEGPHHLPCRRPKGAAAMAAAAERHYLDALETGPGSARRRCDHPPRPWRADTTDQGDRSRPSSARRGRAEGRGKKVCNWRRVAGADDLLLVLFVGRRLRELDRAGGRRVVVPRRKQTGNTGAVALGRADRAEVNNRSQAPVAESRVAGFARAAANAGRKIVTLAISGRSARRSVPRSHPDRRLPDPTHGLPEARAIVAKYGLKGRRPPFARARSMTPKKRELQARR